MDPFEESPLPILTDEAERESPSNREKRKRSESLEKQNQKEAPSKAESAQQASNSGKEKAKEEAVVVCAKKAKKVPELVQKYADAVNNSEGVVRWDDITNKALSRPERSQIRHEARELGLIPEVPMVVVDDRHGKPIECPVFPDKCVVTTLTLPPEQFGTKDSEQFEYLNKLVKVKGFNAEDQSVTDEETGAVKRYTWHHHHDSGKMQLVESGIHSATKHKGGREIWTTGPRK
jgi:hypothetical protein